MRILQTADLHLDSPFAGLDITLAEQRRRELRDTFSRIMRYAGEKKVDMVLIPGDLFDSTFVTRETVSLLVREFAALSCPVVISPGNHDPYCEGSVWKKTQFSDNVHIFNSAELSRISFDELGCDVYGWAFEAPFLQGCPLEGSVENSERINILSCHADTASPISNYAPLPIAAIRAFGADHTALGHIHNPEAANEALSDLGTYCGCPEGRDFGETGEKGVLLIEVEKGKKSITPIRFSKRVYEVRTVNADGCEDLYSIGALIDGLVSSEGFGEEHLLRVILTGAVSPSLVVNTAALCENKRGLFHLEAEDSTSPTWNAEGLYADPGIRGELYRTLLPGLESADRTERERAALALRYALAALRGEDISDN